MKSISKIYFSISFIVLIILLASIFFFKEQGHKDKLQELRRYAVADFEKVLAYENANLLSFALALSEDGALKEALYNEKEAESYQILFKIADRFKKNTHIEHLRLQLLTNDFVILAQNWKKESYGTPLFFRHDLDKLKENPRPKVGIETGRRLTFKATIPIEYKHEKIGYLEVIKFIDELAAKLRQQNIELFALMNPKHIVKNSLMRDFPRLKGYVIANENYNNKLKPKIEEIDWNRLKSVRYVKHKGRFFILKEMLNGENTVIGQYLLILNSKKFKEYQEKNQNVSLLTRFSDEDIYNYVKRWKRPMGGFHTFEEQEWIKLFPYLRQEDREDVRQMLKGKLQSYKKEELIDILLDNKLRVKKRGVIK